MQQPSAIDSDGDEASPIRHRRVDARTALKICPYASEPLTQRLPEDEVPLTKPRTAWIACFLNVVVTAPIGGVFGPPVQSSSNRLPCCLADSTSSSGSAAERCPWVPQMMSINRSSSRSTRQGPSGMLWAWPFAAV